MISILVSFSKNLITAKGIYGGSSRVNNIQSTFFRLQKLIKIFFSQLYLPLNFLRFITVLFFPIISFLTIPIFEEMEIGEYLVNLSMASKNVNMFESVGYLYLGLLVYIVMGIFSCRQNSAQNTLKSSIGFGYSYMIFIIVNLTMSLWPQISTIWIAYPLLLVVAGIFIITAIVVIDTVFIKDSYVIHSMGIISHSETCFEYSLQSLARNISLLVLIIIFIFLFLGGTELPMLFEQYISKRTLVAEVVMTIALVLKAVIVSMVVTSLYKFFPKMKHLMTNELLFKFCLIPAVVVFATVVLLVRCGG